MTVDYILESWTLAAVCNEQTQGWPLGELAEVLGWLVALARPSSVVVVV